MHEKHSTHQTRDSILKYMVVKDMDPHERHARAKHTAQMSQKELSKSLLRKLYQ